MTKPHAPRALVLALLSIAGPVALARLGIMGMGVVDTIMVGQLAAKELPHLALGWAPTAVFLVTGIGLLQGVQVLAARVIGEGRPETAGGVWRKGMAISVVFGAIAFLGLYFGAEPMMRAFGVAPDLAAGAGSVAHILALSLPLHFAFITCSFFLEAIQRPVAGTIVIWIANGLNLAMNLWLVPVLGAEGSAWSTVVGRLLMAGALTAWIVYGAPSRAYGPMKAAPNAPSYGALFAVGGAAAVSQASEAGAFSAMTVIAGRISAEAVATYQIMVNILAVVFMVALGLASATAVLVSDAYGRRDMPYAVRAGWAGMGLNTIAMLILAVVLLILGGPIAHGFTADPALVALLIPLMPIAALILAPDGGQVVMASALRARADNWFPTASHVFAYIVVMPPLAFYLGETLGRDVRGLMEAIFIASVLSVAVLIARFWVLGRKPAELTASNA